MKEKTFKNCEICKLKEAIFICYQCFNYYCDSCFKLIHEMKANKEHKKEKIDDYIPIDIKCEKHPINPKN